MCAIERNEGIVSGMGLLCQLMLQFFAVTGLCHFSSWAILCFLRFGIGNDMAVDLYAMIGADRKATADVLALLIGAAENTGRIDQSIARAYRDILLNPEKRAAYDARLFSSEVNPPADPISKPVSPNPESESKPEIDGRPQHTKRPGKYCRACGEVIDIDAVICVKCGVAVGDVPVKKGGFSKFLKYLFIMMIFGMVAAVAIPSFHTSSGRSVSKKSVMTLSGANLDAVTDVDGLTGACGIMIGRSMACGVDSDIASRCGKRLDAMTIGNPEKRKEEILRMMELADNAHKQQRDGALGSCDDLLALFNHFSGK